MKVKVKPPLLPITDTDFRGCSPKSDVKEHLTWERSIVSIFTVLLKTPPPGLGSLTNKFMHWDASRNFKHPSLQTQEGASWDGLLLERRQASALNAIAHWFWLHMIRWKFPSFFLFFFLILCRQTGRQEPCVWWPKNLLNPYLCSCLVLFYGKIVYICGKNTVDPCVSLLTN